MKKSNTTILLILLVFLLSYSCKKDDDIDKITRADYYGEYYGKDTNSWGGCSVASVEISESTLSDKHIAIKGLTRRWENTIVAVIDQNQITIDNNTFHIEYHSPGGAYYNYNATYFGSGSLDTSNHELIFHFTEKQIFEDTTFVIQWKTMVIKI